MQKLFKNLIILFVIFIPVISSAQSKVMLEYFYSDSCKDCQYLSNDFFPELQKNLGENISLTKYELGDENNFILLLDLLAAQKDNSNASAYLVVNRRQILRGRGEIEKRTREIIQAELQANGLSSKEDKAAAPLVASAKKLAGKFSWAAVFTAGFVDGINPCVFSTFIFFVSMLSVGNLSLKKLVVVGTIYIAAVFMTYLLLGLGIFRVLGWSLEFTYLRPFLTWGMIAILIVLALLSWWDIYHYLLNGSGAVKLRLSEKLKKRINYTLRRSRERAFMPGVVFAAGVVVTLFESVCSGQVYLPTLLLLARESDGVFNRYIGQVLLYNVMFILPLVGLLLIVLFGVKNEFLLKLVRKNLVLGKLALGFFFIFLAVLTWLL